MKKLWHLFKITWLLINIICFLFLFIYAFYIGASEKKYNEATFILALCILGKSDLYKDIQKIIWKKTS